MLTKGSLYFLIIVWIIFIGKLDAFSLKPGRTGEFALGCNIKPALVKEITSHCPFVFTTYNRKESYSERYILAINDPVEVFRYDFHYKVYPLFFLPPIIGGLRDRFIDNIPTYSKLVFTTVIGGIGWQYLLPNFLFTIDYAVLHLYQRYYGNYLHSDTPIDPVTNKIYGFNQIAQRWQFTALASFLGWLSLEFRSALLLALVDNHWHQDQEMDLQLNGLLLWGGRARWSLFLRTFYRKNDLRFDGQTITYFHQSIGVSLGF